MAPSNQLLSPSKITKLVMNTLTNKIAVSNVEKYNDIGTSIAQPTKTMNGVTK